MSQKTLFKISEYNSEYGGDLLESKRKSRRPLSLNLSHHFVLTAETKESGSLIRNRDIIIKCLNEFAEKFKVRIIEKSINSNHCHLLLKFDHRQCYIKFMRAVTGSLTMKLKVKWKMRPYSKMISWGREFKSVCNYIDQNSLEAIGAVDYKPRIKHKAKRVH